MLSHSGKSCQDDKGHLIFLEVDEDLIFVFALLTIGTKQISCFVSSIFLSDALPYTIINYIDGPASQPAGRAVGSKIIEH